MHPELEPGPSQSQSQVCFRAQQVHAAGLCVRGPSAPFVSRQSGGIGIVGIQRHLSSGNCPRACVVDKKVALSRPRLLNIAEEVCVCVCSQVAFHRCSREDNESTRASSMQAADMDYTLAISYTCHIFTQGDWWGTPIEASALSRHWLSSVAELQ